MNLDCLVRNYYELYGTFDGITDTLYGTALVSVAKQTSLSLGDVCCAMQGYPWKDNFTPSEVAKLRREFIRGEKQAVVEKLNANNTTAARKKLGIGVTPKVKKYVPKSFDEGLETLIAEYYKADLSNKVLVNERKLCPFSVWLLKTFRKPSDVVKDPVASQCLVEFKTVKGMQPTIYGRTLYVPKKYSKDEQMKIQESAIAKAMMLDSKLYRWFKIPLHEAITMNYKRPGDYLDLLDYCSTLGITYAGCVRELGIAVPDLELAYEYAGCVFMYFNGHDVVQYDDRDGWFSLDEESFLNLVSINSNKAHIDVSYVVKCLKERMRGTYTGRGDGTDELHCF